MVSQKHIIWITSFIVFKLSLVQNVISPLQTGICSDYIFGCQDCHKHDQEISCTQCKPNLYLFKYRNLDTDTYSNICVTDCKSADYQSAKDEENKQCLNLGPFCQYDEIVTNSVTGKLTPSCAYSFLHDKGYVLGSRYSIMNWMRNVASLDNLDMRYSNTKSISSIQKNSYTYQMPNQIDDEKIIREQNINVVAKCENQYCSLCEHYMLGKCITCQGRFGDQSSNGQGRCYQQKTSCQASTVVPKSISDGCFQLNSDCTKCLIQDLGYGLSQSGTIRNCNETDIECSDCQFDGSNIQCQACNPGFGLSLQTGKCTKCQGHSVKSCSFDIYGIESPDFCQDGFILTNDLKSCRRICDYNEFPYVVMNKLTNKPEYAYCQKCNSACRSCERMGADKCQSCNAMNYLKLYVNPYDGIIARKGTCEPKIDASNSKPYQMLVLNQQNKQTQSPDGQRLFGDLMSAYLNAYKYASTVHGVHIDIFLETGSHFVLKSHIENMFAVKDKNLEIDFENPQFTMTISPLICDNSLNLAYKSKSCKQSKESSEKVILHNKVGEYFQLQVPKSLLFEGIIVDSMSSLIKYSSPKTDVAMTDCYWNATNTFVCPLENNAKNLIKIDQNPICSYRSYDSMFQLKNIDTNLTKIEDIQTLQIRNSSFTNIFYELGSIVRLPQHTAPNSEKVEWPWKLEIENTVFQNMSFCGSVVSNDYPLFEGTDGHKIKDFNDGLKNQIHMYYTKTPNQFIEFDCNNETCYDFKFINNTVSGLNMMKNPTGGSIFFDQKVNWQMQKFAMILQIHNFKGDIKIQGNQFLDNRIFLKDVCIYYENINENTNRGDNFQMSYGSDWTSMKKHREISFDRRSEFLIPSQNSVHQLHSLIVIDNLQEGKSVQITNNTFIGDITSNSLISISQQINSFKNQAIRQGEIVIQSNLFQDSGSYLGANAIIITKIDMKNETQLVNADNFCGKGIKVLNNKFLRVLGTCQTDTGLLRIQCNNTMLAQKVQNETNSESSYSFVNQTRQIALTHGSNGNFFDTTSLDTVVSDGNNSVLVQNNQVQNCSVGISQKSKFGGIKGEKEYIEKNTGTLFSFQDMLYVDFSNNNISSIYPLNDINFYRYNSPHYKYLGQSVKPLTGIVVSQQVSHFDQSSSIITVQNVYKLEIKNCTFQNITANKFLDSVVLHSQSGIRNLDFSENTIENISGITQSILSTKDVNYLELYKIKSPLLHFIKLRNSVFNNLQIDSSQDPYTETLIYDNFHGNFSMKDFQIQNVTISNVFYAESIKTDKTKQVISSLLNLASNNITIEQLNVRNVELWQKQDIGSPFKLQIYNFTQFEVERPKISIIDSSFANITTILGEVQNVTLDMSSKGGLFTMIHDAVSYDVLFNKTSFENIQMKYSFNQTQFDLLSQQTHGTFKPFVASILKTVQTSFQSINTADMITQFSNCNFKDVFYAQDQDVRNQIMHFNKPIKQLLLDGNTFEGVEEAWDKQNGMNRTQILQQFDPNTGPQQILISDSQFGPVQNDIFDSDSLRKEFQMLDFKKISDLKQKNERIYFEFNNYNYTAPVDLLKGQINSNDQHITFRNVNISNINFSYLGQDGRNFSSEGSFIRIDTSNIRIEGVRVANVSSYGKGAFMKIVSSNETMDGDELIPYNQTLIEFVGSNFTNCTAQEGSILYVAHYKIGRTQKIIFSDLNFEGNFAKKHAVFHIHTYNQSIEMKNLKFNANTAFNKNSIMHIKNDGDQFVYMDNILVTNNIVLNGSSSIAFRNSSIILKNSNFIDNFATEGTHGIKIEGSYPNDYEGLQPMISIDNTKFEQTGFKTQDVLSINGSYIQINSKFYGSEDKEQINSKFEPQMNITNSEFSLGYANYGGAIAIQGLKKITVLIDKSKFANNIGYFNGGALFLDDLEGYNITVLNTEFRENKVRIFYGDSLYARQTKLIQTQTRRRMLDGESNNGTERISQQIIMNNVTLTTPNAMNQLYFEGIKNLNLEKMTFNQIQDSQSIEGSSIYCTNCFKFSLNNSTFIGQKSIIRGGALFLEQKSELYFGAEWNNSIHEISNSSFIGCQSQQGGAIASKNVRKTIVYGNNNFQNNVVLQYQNQLKLQATVPVSQKKQFDNIIEQQARGKGPVLYYNCSEEANCNLTIEDGVVIEGSSIINAVTNQEVIAPDATTRSIYYTDKQPSIPINQQVELEQSHSDKYKGTKIILFTNQTEYQNFKNISEVIIERHQQIVYSVDKYMNLSSNNSKEFEKKHNFTNFEVRKSSLFGDNIVNPVAIVDDGNQVQIYDSFSNLTFIPIQQDDQGLPIRTRLVVDGINDSENYTITAKNGFFNVPRIMIQGIPSQNISLKMITKYVDNNSNYVIETRLINLTLANCQVGEIINQNGGCQLCSAPNYYLLEPVHLRTNGDIKLQTCEPCNHEVFTCLGDSQIFANKGYQRVQNTTAEFVECGLIAGNEVCLPNNTCRTGYQGLMCKQCFTNFFRDFDGQCQECSRSELDGMTQYSDGTYYIFRIIGNWLLLLLVLKLIVDMAVNSQNLNSLSSGVYLLKNIVNYIIFITTLSHIFHNVWMREDFPPNQQLRSLSHFARVLFRIPIQSVDNQCYQTKIDPIFTIAKIQSVTVPLTQNNLLDLIVQPSENESTRNFQYFFFASILNILLIFKLLQSMFYPFKDDNPTADDFKIQIKKSDLNDSSQNKANSKQEFVIDPFMITPKKEMIQNENLINQFDHSNERLVVSSQNQQRSLNQGLNTNQLQTPIQNSSILYEGGDSDLPSISDNISVGKYDVQLSNINKNRKSNSHISSNQNLKLTQSGKTFNQTQKITQFDQSSNMQANFKKGARSVKSQRTNRTNRSNYSQITQKIAQKRAIKAEKTRIQELKNKRYNFDPSTLKLMILSFMVNIQIISQFGLTFNCSQVITINGDQIKQYSFNYYDTSVVCEYNQMVQSWQFIAAIIYIIIWVIILPIYVLYRSQTEFIIEYFGMIIKVVLAAIAIYSPFISEFTSGIVVLVLISVQSIFFLMFSSGQARGLKLLEEKIKILNFVDFCMYLVLTIDCYITFVMMVFVSDSNETLEYIVFISIFALNLLYILYWFYNVMKFVAKNLSQQPKYVHLFKCLTCGMGTTSTKELRNKDFSSLNEIIDEKKKEDIEKISVIKEHLEDVLQEMIKEKHKVQADGSKSYNRTTMIDKLQLFDDIEVILNPDLDCNSMDYIDENKQDPIFVKSGHDFNQKEVQISNLDEGDINVSEYSDNYSMRKQFFNAANQNTPVIVQPKWSDLENQMISSQDIHKRNQLLGEYAISKPLSLINKLSNQESLSPPSAEAYYLEKLVNFKENSEDEKLANFFNDTFSNNEIQIALKDVQNDDEEIGENPILKALKQSLAGIEYNNAKLNDNQVLEDQEHNHTIVEQFDLASPVQESEIKKMMRTLGTLNESMKLENSLMNISRSDRNSEFLNQNINFDDPSPQTGVKSEISQMMAMLNNLNSKMKEKAFGDSQNEIQLNQAKISKDNDQEQNPSTVQISSKIDHQEVQPGLDDYESNNKPIVKPQKQKSGEQQVKIMKRISKSMKDDLRKKAAEIKELQKKRNQLKERRMNQ